jgi:hypothetical protein
VTGKRRPAVAVGGLDNLGAVKADTAGIADALSDDRTSAVKASPSMKQGIGKAGNQLYELGLSVCRSLVEQVLQVRLHRGFSNA